MFHVLPLWTGGQGYIKANAVLRKNCFLKSRLISRLSWKDETLQHPRQLSKPVWCVLLLQHFVFSAVILKVSELQVCLLLLKRFPQDRCCF